MENENHLIEEREEVMVSKKGHCLRESHFLQPYDGSVAELPRPDKALSVSSSELLKIFSLRSSFTGFWVAEGHFVYWVAKMEALHAQTWKKAGIFEAIKSSTYNITKHSALILSVSEKWCPQTKSFISPWGEATITLEDVMVLLGFSVLGSPVFAPLETSKMRGSVEKLQKVCREITRKDKAVRQSSWISSFLGRGEMEHEAFLALWLSFFVFPSRTRRVISREVFPIAVRLARGERIAFAPAVLAILYRDLDRIHDLARGKFAETIHLTSLFKLVQVWTWERFRNTSPIPKEIANGEPRISRWNSHNQGFKKDVSCDYFDDFEWRPYTRRLNNWNPLLFYLEEAMCVTVDESIDLEFASFARCVSVSQLAGDGFVEGYFPNRVARQFGFDQDLPCLVSPYRRNFREKEAWDDYNKSLHGLNLYMPSRHDRGFVTARYQDWWMKSVSGFLRSEEMRKEPTETFGHYNEDDEDDDDDDIDTSPKVLPLSHVFKKLEQGFPAKCRRSRMRRLVNRDKVGELVKSFLSSGWNMKQTHEDDDESSMDEEDDGMAIAQRTRSRKKYSSADKSGGDGFQTLGKRTRRYVAADSDDDSEPCQKLASAKIEQRSEEDHDETASKAQKTRRICDDFEVDAEKRTMIDDEPSCNGSIMEGTERNETKKEAECLVHEDEEKKKFNEWLCSEVKKEKENDERFKQRILVIKEMEQDLEARLVEMEKTLAKVRILRTRRNQKKNGVSAA